MLTTCADMKFGEVLPDVANREVVRIDYRKIDKHGRLYIDVKDANKEFLVALIEPVPEDKIKFLKVGRR